MVRHHDELEPVLEREVRNFGPAVSRGGRAGRQKEQQNGKRRDRLPAAKNKSCHVGRDAKPWTNSRSAIKSGIKLKTCLSKTPPALFRSVLNAPMRRAYFS
jgi:hypothetical protein